MNIYFRNITNILFFNITKRFCPSNQSLCHVTNLQDAILLPCDKNIKTLKKKFFFKNLKSWWWCEHLDVRKILPFNCLKTLKWKRMLKAYTCLFFFNYWLWITSVIMLSNGLFMIVVQSSSKLPPVMRWFQPLYCNASQLSWVKTKSWNRSTTCQASQFIKKKKKKNIKWMN